MIDDDRGRPKVFHRLSVGPNLKRENNGQRRIKKWTSNALVGVHALKLPANINRVGNETCYLLPATVSCDLID